MTDPCTNPDLLPLDLAVRKIMEAIKAQGTRVNSEAVSLFEAANRILAADIVSPVNVPPVDNSAMDGYAYIHDDLFKRDALTLVGVAYAGNAYTAELKRGECVRIMTGAPIPKGADTVIMQEETEKLENDNIRFLKIKPKGNNVRKAGENIALGSMVMQSGTRLSPSKIALFASLGEAKVTVYNKVKVGLLATGDELIEPGVTLSHGQIYESNRIALLTLLKQFGAQVIDYGIVKDKPESIRKVFQRADNECDLVISSGGVSVGEADLVKDVLKQIGQVGFWKVAIKPGKPFAFGKLENAWFCGLPGNPVSSFVTCQQLVLPLISALQNEKFDPPPPISAITTTDIRKPVGRKDFQRGICHVDEAGTIMVAPNGPQGSGIMTSIANANCYIVLEAERGDVSKGETVKILPFSRTYS